MPLMFQPLQKYAVFSGRARRMEYWLFQLLIVGLNVLPHGVVYLIADRIFHPYTVDSFVDGINIVLYAGLLLPNLAVTVRRLHDMDRRGWWVLIVPWFWLPIWLLEEYEQYEYIDTDRPEAAIVMLIFVVGFVWFLVLMCMRGTRGENRFGSDPLSPEPAAGNSGADGESTRP